MRLFPRMRVLFLPLLLSSCVLVDAEGADWVHDDDDDHHASERRTVNMPGRSDELPFSHGVLAGDTYYVAGTLGLDPETGQAPEDVEREVKLLLDAFRDKLALVGMDMDDLVSVQVFCPELDLYDTFNGIYATYFDDEYPVRAFVGSGPLLRGCRFEINGIAVRR